MATIESTPTTWSGQTKPFWGLVQQDGPWSRTKSDLARSKMKDVPTIGGGVGAGGREHAGHGNWKQVMTPYQIDATGAPPKPSPYAMRSVLIAGGVDMKRQRKIGRVKVGLTLAGRTPLQTNQKAGMSSIYEDVEGDEALYGQGVRLGAIPGSIKPEVPMESQSGPFVTTHGIEEKMPGGFPDLLSANGVSFSEDVDMPHVSPGGFPDLLSANGVSFSEDVDMPHVSDPNNFYGEVVDVPPPVPSFKRQPEYMDQREASAEAIQAERKRKGSFQPGPEDSKSIRTKEPSAERKRKGSLTPANPSKSVRTKEPSAERKRRASVTEEGEGKKARTIFKGPLQEETHNSSSKRKGESMMSEKYKKTKKEEEVKKQKPRLKISTANMNAPTYGETMIGKRKGVRAENKSAPVKENNIPTMKRRRR